MRDRIFELVGKEKKEKTSSSFKSMLKRMYC